MFSLNNGLMCSDLVEGVVVFGEVEHFEQHNGLFLVGLVVH